MTDDLFAEFAEAAAEYGWRGIGQPERHTRRYGRGNVTVSVYSNRSGLGIRGARRTTISPVGQRRTEDLLWGDRGKRDTVLEWLRS